MSLSRSHSSTHGPSFPTPCGCKLCTVGACAVLFQSDDGGVDQPMGFYSRKFNSFQPNYSVIEKESSHLGFTPFQGLSWFWYVHLVGYTNHNPITFLHSLQCPNHRFMWWILFLQSYHLDISHIKGSERAPFHRGCWWLEQPNSVEPVWPDVETHCGCGPTTAVDSPLSEFEILSNKHRVQRQ